MFALKELDRSFSAEKEFGFAAIEKITEEDLRTLTLEQLYSFGFGNWDGESLILYPLWVVNFIEGNPEVTSIMGNVSTLQECDKDVRFGCIAWGFFYEEEYT